LFLLIFIFFKQKQLSEKKSADYLPLTNTTKENLNGFSPFVKRYNRKPQWIISLCQTIQKKTSMSNAIKKKNTFFY
jgi:hypothetical protein